MGSGGRSVPRGCYRLLTASRNPDTSVGPVVAQLAGGPRAGVSAATRSSRSRRCGRCSWTLTSSGPVRGPLGRVARETTASQFRQTPPAFRPRRVSGRAEAEIERADGVECQRRWRHCAAGEQHGAGGRQELFHRRKVPDLGSTFNRAPPAHEMPTPEIETSAQMPEPREPAGTSRVARGLRAIRPATPANRQNTPSVACCS